MSIYTVLAASVDLTHALSMLLWGLGLPLLVWHRFPRLSRAYMWFSAIFVVISVISHRALGECELWHAGGGYREGVPFMALLANRIAGFRPSNRQVVLLWEAAILVTSIGGLWCWRRTARRYTTRS
jgi:hypothetical protein